MTTDSRTAEVSGAPAASDVVPAASAAPRAGARRWLAIGTGVGVEIRGSNLHVTVARLRRGVAKFAASLHVTGFRERPAAEWGNELLSFLRRHGAAHMAAYVLLPRRDVIVRVLALPGVRERDLVAAVRLQVDTLHPFTDEDVSFSVARLGRSGQVLVGIARRQVIAEWSTLFAEAGIKVASFTFPAAVIHSALRMSGTSPGNVLALLDSDSGVEIYGESEARPLYSAFLPVAPERAAALAASELRLEPGVEPVRLPALLPLSVPASGADSIADDDALSVATAITAACPWLGIDGNLLPAELRRASSRVRLIPTFTLAAALAGLLVVVAFQSTWFDSRYLALLQHEISRYEPRARRVDTLERSVTQVRQRSQSLDDFRRRARLDMDTIAAVTRLIPPPGWVSSLEMDRETVQISGETDAAAPLLKEFDTSPLFEQSEFTMPISRTPSGEIFRIRAKRSTPPVAAATQPAASPGASK